MSELINKYEELTVKRRKIENELKQLEESEIVKRYLKLKRQNENLYNQQLGVLKAVEESYSSCNTSNTGISVMVKMFNNAGK